MLVATPFKASSDDLAFGIEDDEGVHGALQ
jgi:hypothetical protein